MTERDPRKDPRPGDLFIFPDHGRGEFYYEFLPPKNDMMYFCRVGYVSSNLLPRIELVDGLLWQALSWRAVKVFKGEER